MNYVIRVVSLRTDKKFFEHNFEAPSRKEAQDYMLRFMRSCWFKQKDFYFNLWEQKDGFTFEKVEPC